MRALDLTEQRFGKLKVIKRLDEKLGKKVLWLCECDCGDFTKSTTSNLTRGYSKSCGCVRTKHNGKGTRLYRIWTGMKDRCTNPNSKYRKRYGGRGISVCHKWLNNFATFREWALKNGYQNHLEIDRKDNDGDYCPENCRWVTPVKNSQNRSSSKLNKRQVLEIKRILATTDKSPTSIGARFNVSSSTIRDIKNNKIWTDVGL